MVTNPVWIAFNEEVRARDQMDLEFEILVRRLRGERTAKAV